MKKKKQRNFSPPLAVPSTTTTTTSDLKSLIHDHGLFFDKLVELIPAKFYLSNGDVNDFKPWFQGLSKAAKASNKQQTRENIKKACRDRLDPQKSQTTTVDLLRQTIKDEGLEQKIDLDGGDTKNDTKIETDEETERKKRKGSKVKELERAKRLEGEVVAKKHSWKGKREGGGNQGHWLWPPLDFCNEELYVLIFNMLQ